MRVLLRATSAVLLLGLALPARADDQADLQKLLDQAIKAHGGADKLDKHQAAVMKLQGKFYGMGEGIPFEGEWKVQGLNQFRNEITVEVMGMKIPIVIVLDGDKGWVQAMGNTQDMDKDKIAESKEDLYAGWVTRLVPLKGKGFTLSALGEAKVGDRPAVGIKVVHAGRPDINLFFDKETHLLLKSERRAREEGKEFTQETLYQDYKPVEGVQQPHKAIIQRDGKKHVEAEVTEYKAVEKLEDSTFAKP